MHVIAGEVVSNSFLVEMEVGKELLPTTEGKSIDDAEEDESPPENINSDAPEHRKDEEGIDYGCNRRFCCKNPNAPCPTA